MSATTKFYAGFFIALALVIAVGFVAGYRVGYGHAISDRTHARAKAP